MKLSQEFSRTKSFILGALSRLDEFFLNPPIWSHPRSAPELSQSAYGLYQGTKEDDSLSGIRPETRISLNQTMENAGP